MVKNRHFIEFSNLFEQMADDLDMASEGSDTDAGSISNEGVNDCNLGQATLQTVAIAI